MRLLQWLFNRLLDRRIRKSYEHVQFLIVQKYYENLLRTTGFARAAYDAMRSPPVELVDDAQRQYTEWIFADKMPRLRDIIANPKRTALVFMQHHWVRPTDVRVSENP